MRDFAWNRFKFTHRIVYNISRFSLGHALPSESLLYCAKVNAGFAIAIPFTQLGLGRVQLIDVKIFLMTNQLPVCRKTQ
jgi:hypothetical protein